MTPTGSPPPKLFKKRRRTASVVAFLLLLGVAGTAAFVVLARDRGGAQRVGAVEPCEVDPAVLRRVARGYYPKRSGDVLMIEKLPNQFGDRHSTPWPYTQDVPLVLYGPGYIRSGRSDARVTVAALAPTFAELLDFELGATDGDVLHDALLPRHRRNGVPKLIVTVVWDGGGDNVLRRWPNSWPQLRRLMRRGFDHANATVGSSPSITPAVHATIGTGLFPSTHGLPDIKIRIRNHMTDAWEGASPKFLEAETLVDRYDRALGNEPLIGMLARDSWHLGMIGHGSFLEGADKDIAVLDDLGGIGFRTNPDYYTLPDYLLGTEGLEEAVDEVDQRDGELDRRWLGNALLPYAASVRYTPAFSIYQTQKIIELLTNEGFGRDDVPDLFFTNYKAPDLAGHEWNMVEEEVRDNIAEADAQIPVLIDALDRVVGRERYVLALTADHGQTPYPEVRGGWSINVREMTEDIERRFNRNGHEALVLSNRGYQLMLDRKIARDRNVSAASVARFVRNYRLEDNVPAKEAVPEEFADRVDERLYLAAFTPDELRDALRCAENAAHLPRPEQGTAGFRSRNAATSAAAPAPA